MCCEAPLRLCVFILLSTTKVARQNLKSIWYSILFLKNEKPKQFCIRRNKTLRSRNFQVALCDHFAGTFLRRVFSSKIKLENSQNSKSLVGLFTRRFLCKQEMPDL